MTPQWGLSMSAMRKNAIDAITGKTKSANMPVLRSRYPIRKLEKIAINPIRAHAATGMRFNHAACVNPCELKTSFIPEAARAATGVDCAIAARTTDAQKLSLHFDRIDAGLSGMLIAEIEHDALIYICS